MKTINYIVEFIERIKIFLIICCVPIGCLLIALCYFLHFIFTIICTAIDVCLLPVYTVIWIFTDKFYFGKLPDYVMERSFTEKVIMM